MIYMIKSNIWTGTYYIYRDRKPTQLRKNTTKAMRDFMETAKVTVEGNFTVYRKAGIRK